MGDPWRLLATISEPQLCFGREISLKGPLDTVEIVIEYMVNMVMVDRDMVGLFIKLCHWVPKGSIFSQNRSKSMVSKLQVPFLFGFYLKIRERKKLERKKVRAWPLCHPRQPTHEPFRFIGHINASVP